MIDQYDNDHKNSGIFLSILDNDIRYFYTFYYQIIEHKIVCSITSKSSMRKY